MTLSGNIPYIVAAYLLVTAGLLYAELWRRMRAMASERVQYVQLVDALKKKIEEDASEAAQTAELLKYAVENVRQVEQMAAGVRASRDRWQAKYEAIEATQTLGFEIDRIAGELASVVDSFLRDMDRYSSELGQSPGTFTNERAALKQYQRYKESCLKSNKTIDPIQPPSASLPSQESPS